MRYRKKLEEENKSKLNMLNLIHPCKVVLHDIALNTELLSFYEQKLLKDAQTRLKQVSSSYISNSFNNVHFDIKYKNTKVKKSTQKENVIIIDKRSSCKRRKEEYESECSREMVKYDTHTHNTSTDTNYIRHKVFVTRKKHDNVMKSSKNRKNRISSSEKIVNVHDVLIDTSYNNTNEIVAPTSHIVSNTFGKKKDTATLDEETMDNHICNASIDESIYNNENTLSEANKKHDSNVSLCRKESIIILDKEDTDQIHNESNDANCDNANKIITKEHNSIISLLQEERSKASFDETLVEHHAISKINDMNTKSVKSVSNDIKCLNKKLPTFLDCNSKIQIKCSIPIKQYNNLYLVNTNSTDTNDLDKKTSFSAGIANKLQMISNIRINNKLSSIDIIKATKCVVKLQQIDINLYKKNVSANESDIDLGKHSSSVSRSVTNVKTDIRTNLNNEHTSSIMHNTLKTSETSPEINHVDKIIPGSPEICIRKSNKKKISVKEQTISLLTKNKILSKQNMQTVQLKRKRYMIEDDCCEQDSMEKTNYDNNVKETSPINESAIKAANVITKENEHPEKNKSYNIFNTTKLALEINNNSNFRVENTIVNKNISDFTDVDKTQEVDRSISVNKERIQTEYPCLGGRLDSGSKRIRLNRNTPLDTDKIDLRKILEERRKLRQLKNLENKSNVTYKYNEKDTSVSEQIIANTYNNTCNIISINTSDINDKRDVSDTNSEIETNSSHDNESSIGFAHENEDICDNVETQEQNESNINKKTSNDSFGNDKNNDNDNTDYNDDDYNNDDDDDCISLYANETFDESQDDSVHEENKTNKPVHSNEKNLVREEDKTNKSVINKSVHSNEYVMSDNSIDNYLRHNTHEFNKEYANNVNDSIEKLNGLNKTEKIPTIQQTLYTIKTKYQNEAKIFNGYCFVYLRKNNCTRNMCMYKHDVNRLIMIIVQKPVKTIVEIMRYAIQTFPQFSKICYLCLLQHLRVEQILTFFHMFYDNNFTFGTEEIEKLIVHLSRHRKMSLKLIVDCIVTYMPIKRTLLNELYIIIEVVKQCIKPSEYWDTLRTIYFAVIPINADKFIIHDILLNCINNRQLHNVNDIDKLLHTLDPIFVSQLDGNILRKFRSLLAEKNGTNSNPTTCVATSVQYFGKSGNNMQTIASPDPYIDGRADTSECDILFCDVTPINNADTIKIKRSETNNRDKSYVLKLIDKNLLPEPRSVFRYHEHCWKFYLDLDRLKMGFQQKDYDYIIDILKLYVDEQATDKIFYYTCEILRNEIRRSFKNHVKTLLQRAVQRDVFGDLGTFLFDLGLTIVASLVDEEAWGLAHQVIHSLSVYDFPYNAAFYLLLAEIYLANKNPLEALNLLKTQNIISTSRSRWCVKSIINDEDIRNKIIYILLDLLLCNEYIEHAFFLFRFLIVDQTSQYYPIDLSRYVDKLIISSLSKKDIILLREISILTLKYTFALKATTCRALLSTVMHSDEALARQIYNYAKNIGVYSKLQLWPITSIILSTDLTEEEIYVIIWQMLKDLLLDLGHAAEFAKFSQVKVFLILEMKSSEVYYAKCYHDTIYTNAKSLIKKVLKKRFEPPLILQSSRDRRICRIQSKSLIDHLKAIYCS